MCALVKPGVGIIALAALFSSALRGEVQPPASALWYGKPASHWLEALPVGNGRMGAMVFGGVTSERVQFNEQTLWTGTNASQKITGHNTGDGAMGDYQPFGDVFLRFPSEHAACKDCRGQQDDTAVAKITGMHKGRLCGEDAFRRLCGSLDAAQVEAWFAPAEQMIHHAMPPNAVADWDSTVVSLSIGKPPPWLLFDPTQATQPAAT